MDRSFLPGTAIAEARPDSDEGGVIQSQSGLTLANGVYERPTPTLIITIDGHKVEARKGETIMDVARRNGIDIPSLCSDPRIKPTGVCGICAVEIAGTPGQPRACVTAVEEGMWITVESTTLRAHRKSVLDSLLGNHNAYCLPPCQYACPAGVDVAGFINLITRGDYGASTSLIKERTPLPRILGRVCPHPCEAVCRRAQVDEPVAICALGRFAADRAAEEGAITQPAPAPPTGKRVAIVGSGPAGLSAAYYLALDGHEVTILESLEKPGGMLRYGIPPYRLPKDVLDREIADIAKLGVRIETDQALGRDFHLDDLKSEGYGAILLGVGASIGKAGRIPGEDAVGVLSALDFLGRVNRGGRVNVGDKVVVVGGGFTAADAARTARRLGASSVILSYRRSRAEMPASPHEIHECEVEGVTLDLLAAPIEITVEDGRAVGIVSQRMRLGEKDASGRRKPEPVPGSNYFTPADTILLAIGQDVDLAGLHEEITPTRWSSIEIDDLTMTTSIPGVFATGDCASGAATVVEAVGGGRRVAVAISAYLAGKGKQGIAAAIAETTPSLFAIGVHPKGTHHRAEMPVVPGPERCSSFGREVTPGSLGADDGSGAFAEVDLGLDEATARREAQRCFQCRCQAAGSCSLQGLSIEHGAGNRRFEGSKPFFPVLRSHPFFEMNREKCIRCQMCVRICDEVQHRKVYIIGDDGYPALVSGSDDYRDTDCNNCGQCVSVCPTGALKDLTDSGSLRSSQRQSAQTICVYCGVGCALDLQTEHGKVVAARNSFASESNRGNLCVKGRFGFDFINHPDRLRTPLIRRGGKSAPLEPASWDEAIQLTAQRLKEIKVEHGADAICGLNSSKATNEDNFVFQKFMRAVIGTNNVDHCARLCHIASAVALGNALGSSAPTASIRDIAHADCILIIGSNTTETHPVISGSVLEAKYHHGAKIIVADPRRIEMVDHADVWLRPANGTNVALLNGLAHVILRENLSNASFIESRTEGWEEVQSVLASYTPEYVSELTGVPAERLVAAALAYGEAARGMVLWGMGITQHLSGVDSACAIANLALMTGHIGRPGTGLMPLRGQNNVQGASDMGLPNSLPGYQPINDVVVRAKFERRWNVTLPTRVGLTVVEMEKAANDGIVKAMYVQGENPMLSSPDILHVEKALRNLEFLVVQDIFLSETARLADVVFPVASFAEKEGTFTNTERRVQLIRPAIPAVGESRPDWQIISAVATAMGYPMTYASPAAIMEEIAELTPQYGGIRHDRLDANGLMWPCTDTSHVGTRVLYGSSFPRGRGRFTVVEQATQGEETEDDFPLILSTGRLLEHYHTGTMTRRAKGLHELTPEGEVEVHPEDARRAGIFDGQRIRLITKRGTVEALAKLTERTLEGVVFYPFHFGEAPANRLTSSQTDPASKTPAYKRSAARIEPAVTA